MGVPPYTDPIQTFQGPYLYVHRECRQARAAYLGTLPRPLKPHRRPYLPHFIEDVGGPSTGPEAEVELLSLGDAQIVIRFLVAVLHGQGRRTKLRTVLQGTSPLRNSLLAHQSSVQRTLLQKQVSPSDFQDAGLLSRSERVLQWVNEILPSGGCHTLLELQVSSSALLPRTCMPHQANVAAEGYYHVVHQIMC